MVHQEQEVGLQDGAMLDQGMYIFISIFRFLEENNIYKLRLRHDKKYETYTTFIEYVERTHLF